MGHPVFNSEALFKVLAGIAEQDEVLRSSKCLGRERKVIIFDTLVGANQILMKKTKITTTCCAALLTEQRRMASSRRKRKLCERFLFT